MQPLAVEGDLEIAPAQPFPNRVLLFGWGRGGVGGVGAAIPKHTGAAAVFALWNRPLEGVVVNRVIFDLHGEPFHRGVETWSLRHGPTLHDSVELEPKIEMQMARSVLLDDETQSPFPRGLSGLISRRLARAGEVAFFSVFGELGASARR